MHRLAATADVVIENYGPGTMERLGCGYETLAEVNPRLVYLALKGYLAGPYEHRPALDEVVQFQVGLAYMTGPPGQPLRAGASIIDILGAVFGVVAAQAALRERETTGKGQRVSSALFESAAFLMSHAHGRHGRDRPAGAADAGAARRLGDLRGVHTLPTGSCSSASPATSNGPASSRSSGCRRSPPIRASPPTLMRSQERAWLIPALKEVLAATAAGRGGAALRARQRLLGAGRPAGRPVRRRASAGDAAGCSTSSSRRAGGGEGKKVGLPAAAGRVRDGARAPRPQPPAAAHGRAQRARSSARPGFPQRRSLRWPTTRDRQRCLTATPRDRRRAMSARGMPDRRVRRLVLSRHAVTRPAWSTGQAQAGSPWVGVRDC